MKRPLLRPLILLASTAAFLPLAACGGSSPENSSTSGEATTEASAAPASALPKEVAQCVTCHTFEKGGPSRNGPNLYGVAGKPAATASSFRYSSALQKSGIVWSDEQLDAYLASPRKAVPGTRMTYPGESDPAKRQAMIAFMKQQSDAK